MLATSNRASVQPWRWATTAYSSRPAAESFRRRSPTARRNSVPSGSRSGLNQATSANATPFHKRRQAIDDRIEQLTPLPTQERPQHAARDLASDARADSARGALGHGFDQA